MPAIDKPLCIIPARGGSKRFPRKNIALLKGKPLLAYTIEAALDSAIFGKIMVSTEDEEIANIARLYGAQVPFMRSAKYAKDTARILDVCLYMLDALESKGVYYNTLYVLQPTSPLRTASDVRAAWQLFESSESQFLLSVTNFEHPPFRALQQGQDGSLTPFWGRRYIRRAQELPTVFSPNGAIAIANIDAFKAEKTFYGTGVIGYYMPRLRSADIDEADDLLLVECIMEMQSKLSTEMREKHYDDS